jgi:hypothetical protein
MICILILIVFFGPILLFSTVEHSKMGRRRRRFLRSKPAQDYSKYKNDQTYQKIINAVFCWDLGGYGEKQQQCAAKQHKESAKPDNQVFLPYLTVQGIEMDTLNGGMTIIFGERVCGFVRACIAGDNALPQRFYLSNRRPSNRQTAGNQAKHLL